MEQKRAALIQVKSKLGIFLLVCLLGAGAAAGDAPATSPSPLTGVVLLRDEKRDIHSPDAADPRLAKVAWSDDGKRLITNGIAGSAAVWDGATGAKLVEFVDGQPGMIFSAAFSRDGKQAVLGSVERSGGKPADATATIWSVADGRLVVRLVGHTAPVMAATFTPDGRQVVTSALDSTIRVWDSNTGQQQSRLDLPRGVWVSNLALVENGTAVVLPRGDHIAEIRRLSTWELLWQYRDPKSSFAGCDATQAQDIVGFIGTTRLVIARPNPWQVVLVQNEPPNMMAHVRLSLGGRVAIVGANWSAKKLDDGTSQIQVIDAATGRLLASDDVCSWPEGISGLAVNSAGEIAVAMGSDIRFWKLQENLARAATTQSDDPG